ncbi:MAG: prepilin-type N-terminal cleavage/methylation domain-containing protein [Verrucomicrobiales bacterium]|jgi:prepilin-type N-terminal cleavage/methylation domain-containing protein|nr:prepilin-type N-terminal cleavage/methylation domain-containing protein [Verrucomicrobiales bacterium]
MKTNITLNRRYLTGGFTLIEIMLVLAIIALLAGTAI